MMMDQIVEGNTAMMAYRKIMDPMMEKNLPFMTSTINKNKTTNKKEYDFIK